MLRCYLTGLEISANQAYMLDKKAIQTRLWEITREQATLSKLFEELGPVDKVKILGRKKLHHRLVCESVARSLARDTQPFKPFIRLRQHHINLNLERIRCLHEDAPPGTMFSSLNQKDLFKIAERVWKVIGQLTPKYRNDKVFIKALIELICPAFYILGEDEEQLNYIDITELKKLLLSTEHK